MRQIGVLAVLFVVLLAAVITKEASRPEAGALRDQVPLVALGAQSFSADDVQTFEVAGPGGATPFTVRRDGERWLVDADFTAPASAGVVERFLQDAAAARGELRLDDAAKLAKFDLSPERATTVTLHGEGGTELARFALGRSSGTDGAFVRLFHDDAESDAAYAVSRDLRAHLGLGRSRSGDETPAQPDAAHFHDLALAPLSLADATRVDLSSPNWTLAYEKAGAEWSPVTGTSIDVPTKPAGVRNIIQQLGGSLKATALVDPSRRAELGLDEAPYRVQVTLADGSVRAAVGAPGPERTKFYVRLDVEQDPDVVYEATRYAWERLFPPAKELFDFKTLDVADDGLTRFEVRRAEGGLAMSRESGRPQDDWVLESPRWGLGTKQSQLRSLTSILRGIRPVDFVAEPPPFQEEITLAWQHEGAALPTALKIGQEAPSGDGRMAVFPDAPERVFVIPQTTVDRVAPDLMTLHDVRPLDGVTYDDVTAVSVRVPGGDDVYRVTRGESGAWTLTGLDAEHPADAVAVVTWVDRLIALEVMDVIDGVTPDREIVVERKTGDPIVIGVATAGDGARIVLGDAGFETDGENLVPDAASLDATEDDGGAETVPDDQTPDEGDEEDE